MIIKKIDSPDYFKNNIWDRTENESGSVRTDDGVFYIKNGKYPKYFKYEESFDLHFCGDWYEVTREDYNKYILDLIESKQKDIKKLRSMIE